MENGQFLLQDNVRVTNELIAISANTGTFGFRDGELISANLTGDPAKLHITLDKVDVDGLAQKVSYDDAHRVVSMSGNVQFTSPGGEYHCSTLSYNLATKFMNGEDCQAILRQQ